MEILGVPLRDLLIPAALVFWIVANLWILPKLGIRT